MHRLLGSLLLAACATACAPDGGPGEIAPDPPPQQGDLGEIRDRGTLRVLLPERVVVDQLPRGGVTLGHERQLIEQFARDEGLKPVWIRVASREQLIAKLLAGHGDIAADPAAGWWSVVDVQGGVTTASSLRVWFGSKIEVSSLNVAHAPDSQPMSLPRPPPARPTAGNGRQRPPRSETHSLMSCSRTAFCIAESVKPRDCASS